MEDSEYAGEIEETVEVSLSNTLQKYDFSVKVSRGVFNLTDPDMQPWISPKPTPLEPNPVVYQRLYSDFHRRQEAQRRLSNIIEFKEKRNRDILSKISSENSRLKRSQSKPDVNRMIDRFNAFWDQKWLRIEEKRRLLAEKQEEEFKELIKNKKFYRSDPEAFRRLTTVKTATNASISNKPKQFSIKEAIESGKRLMHANGNRTPSPTKSFDSRRSYSAEKPVRAQIRKFSPSKTLKPKTNSKEIQELLRKCKTKASFMNTK